MKKFETGDRVKFGIAEGTVVSPFMGRVGVMFDDHTITNCFDPDFAHKHLEHIARRPQVGDWVTYDSGKCVQEWVATRNGMAILHCHDLSGHFTTSIPIKDLRIPTPADPCYNEERDKC